MGIKLFCSLLKFSKFFIGVLNVYRIASLRPPLTVLTTDFFFIARELRINTPTTTAVVYIHFCTYIHINIYVPYIYTYKNI